jgi:hypothetical protein
MDSQVVSVQRTVFPAEIGIRGKLSFVRFGHLFMNTISNLHK